MNLECRLTPRGGPSRLAEPRLLRACPARAKWHHQTGEQKARGGHACGFDVYLNYRGNCKQAFRFYEQHLQPTSA